MSEAVSSAVAIGPEKPQVAAHFQTEEQQTESAFIGMWLFLVQEVMFFGGLFVAYSVYRMKYPITWYEGSAHLNYTIGTVNTVVLLLSSVTMAFTVYATQTGKWRMQLTNFSLTLILGVVFLVIKAFEYHEKYTHGLIPAIAWSPDPQGFTDPARAQLFYVIYFIMTGMHALHMIIGIAIGAVYLALCAKKKYGPHKYVAIELFGFYWHFVDIVWVFLFPMMYLISSPAGVH